jgi:phage shock protein C
MFCSHCGKPLEPTARFCTLCGATREAVPPPFAPGFQGPGQLVRPRSPRMIAGVCAGFSEHYGWDLNLVRVLTVVITLFTGVTLFAYLAAWIIIPEGQYMLPMPPPSPTPPPTASPTN